MACLGGDGVILHASNLFRGAVPPVVSFNLGSLGFLTSHTVSFLTQLFFFCNCAPTTFFFLFKNNHLFDCYYISFDIV